MPSRTGWHLWKPFASGSKYTYDVKRVNQTHSGCFEHHRHQINNDHGTDYPQHQHDQHDHQYHHDHQTSSTSTSSTTLSKSPTSWSMPSDDTRAPWVPAPPARVSHTAAAAQQSAQLGACPMEAQVQTHRSNPIPPKMRKNSAQQIRSCLIVLCQEF